MFEVLRNSRQVSIAAVEGRRESVVGDDIKEMVSSTLGQALYDMRLRTLECTLW